MDGMMMDFPLTVQMLMDHANRVFPEREIVTRVGEGVERATYAQLYARCGRLANALQRLGIAPGDRVGSYAWNHARHLELYFGAPCSGVVLHTVNIRLFPEQTAYTINHAADRVLFVDRSLLPSIEAIHDRLETVEHIVVLDDGPAPDGAESYEELLAAESPDFDWPRLDEATAAMICYTSGTTGDPKGVVYSHRSIVLHTFAFAHRDSADIAESDVVMPVVPMFHAAAWGYPYACTGFGAKLVLPGPAPVPADLLRLIECERVSVASGVPTIWLAALPLFRDGTYDVSSLRRILSGGAAVPVSMVAAYRELGITITQGWGMTETSPLATASTLRSELRDLSPQEQDVYRAKQGVPVLGCEVKILDDAGREVPWDGSSYGEAVVRGPWVTSGYLRADSADRFTPDGWFRMGDVITIDPLGYVQVIDRTKDLVKSGGEWISSVALESALMGHPAVQEAAVIAVPHERWGERPLACVVPAPVAGSRLAAQEVVEYLRERFPAFWLPDAVAFIDEVPKTSVGKFDKKTLRQRFAEGDLRTEFVVAPEPAYPR